MTHRGRQYALKGLVYCALTLGLAPHLAAQASPEKEMLITSQGFLVMTVPKGFSQVNQDPLILAPKHKPNTTPPVYIALILHRLHGEEQGTTDQAMARDIEEFGKRFPKMKAVAQKPMELHGGSVRALIQDFQSGQKMAAFQRSAMFDDSGCRFTFTFGAASEALFKQYLPVFTQFLASYGGSITMGTP